MEEISKYDIELFLDQYDLSIVDIYINNGNQLIMEVEKDDYGKDIDKEMILAELEQSFNLFESVNHDTDFEKFVVELNANVMLID